MGEVGVLAPHKYLPIMVIGIALAGLGAPTHAEDAKPSGGGEFARSVFALEPKRRHATT